jgi:colanic acid/amylovoran biosynthesis glycosyltransferase
LRVLHFVNIFSQPTETFIKRYVQKSQAFANTAVVAFNLNTPLVSDLKESLQVYEIANRLYTRKNFSGALRFVKEYLSGIQKWHYHLQQIITEFKPDVVHCHFGTMGVIWMHFEEKFKTGIPYVTSFYGYDASSLPFTDNKYRHGINNLWATGTAFFAEGPELAKKLIKLGCSRDKCLINPLLIPANSYPIKNTFREIDSIIKFLFVGRFVEKKGFHIFLSAIGELKNKIPPFTIDIIGSGSYQSVYESIISKYQLHENINWLGMKEHSSIIDVLKDYDFLVHPSITASDNDSEGGAPSIIIEAQAAGLPIITTHHDDIPYVMGYHDFLARENDIDSLTDVIKRIVKCEDIERYAKLGLDIVYRLHDLENNTSYQNNLSTVMKK